mmetsp:Transcript_20981/g.45638  ORF Transcript_20981/g.45638 Transcript_20981/m.45638 type:complete len:200 (+) Transcript_20981:838-1437(+)
MDCHGRRGELRAAESDVRDGVVAADRLEDVLDAARPIEKGSRFQGHLEVLGPLPAVVSDVVGVVGAAKRLDGIGDDNGADAGDQDNWRPFGVEATRPLPFDHLEAVDEDAQPVEHGDQREGDKDDALSLVLHVEEGNAKRQDEDPDRDPLDERPLVCKKRLGLNFYRLAAHRLSVRLRSPGAGVVRRFLDSGPATQARY